MVFSMPSRNGSFAIPRPQRTKSTPSFRPTSMDVPSPRLRDSKTDDQNALTAAHVAYERGRDRGLEQKGPMTVDRHPRFDNAGGKKQGLSRKQSIRFVGPNATTTMTRSITCREAPEYRASVESHRQSLQSRMGDSSRMSARVSITALPEGFDDVYIASEPSSYRRLRKTRSMFSPSKATFTGRGDNSSSSRRHLQRHSLQRSDDIGEPIYVPDPRLKRSYSFVRGVTDKLSTGNRGYVTHDAAIQLARDTYLQQVEQQRLRGQPSVWTLSKRHRTQKPLRRTVRSSSTNSYGTAVSSPMPFPEPMDNKRPGSKVRSISQTFKEKLRRVFKRPSIDKVIPAQHLEATHKHYGSLHGSTQQLPSYLEPNAELLHRVDSREFVADQAQTTVCRSPRPDSIQSAGSGDYDDYDKSRVTSWTDSTVGNTSNMPIYIERKRLSIIKEDGGPHQSSTSNQQHDRLAGGYAAFRHPVEKDSTQRIETKRMFSALQREMDQKNQTGVSHAYDPSTDIDTQGQRKHTSLPDRGRVSSNYPNVRRTNSIPEFNPSHDSEKSSSMVPAFSPASNRSDNSSTTQDLRHRLQASHYNHKKDLTPQEVADLNESGMSLSKHPLREVGSVFFPPSVRIERSNTSPFRRAMYAENDQEIEDANWLAEQRVGVGGQVCNGSTAGSGSVYSRSSVDQTTKTATASCLSLARTESSGDVGTAVIITSRPPVPNARASPFFPRRHSSLTTGDDWKSFMDCQVSSLEDTTGRLRGHMGVPQVRTSGHRKESAQVDGDDLKIGTVPGPDSAVKQPLGLIQTSAIASSAPMNGNRVSMDEKLSTRQVTNRNDENLPATSAVTSPRESGGLHYQDVSLAPRTAMLSTPRQKSWQASLKSQNGLTETSASGGHRYSPERAERLRRLKSSSFGTLRSTPSGNEQPRTGKTANSPGQKSEVSEACPDTRHRQAGKNHKLVDSFLRDRRGQMRISEEGNTEPAFL